MEGHAPVYVKVNDYEEVLSVVENIKKKVTEARETLTKLNELKAEEDRELQAWHESIEDIGNRVSQIDKNLMGQ